MNISESIIWAKEALRSAGVDDAGGEAEFLLTHVLGCKRHLLVTEASRVLTDEQESVFKEFIARRAKREPSQYITGETEFYGIRFKVNRATLVPRPETELLIDSAIQAANELKGRAPLTILDLCAGSGCISVAIALKIPGCVVFATDISKDALKTAKENALMNNAAERVTFLEGDLFSALKGTNFKKADIIVSNPPYIPLAEFKGLEPEVIEHEPREALYGGVDGLDFYRRIIKEAPDQMTSGGFLMLEMGFGQCEAINGLMATDGRYEDIKVTKDYSGIERVITGRVLKTL